MDQKSVIIASKILMAIQLSKRNYHEILVITPKYLTNQQRPHCSFFSNIFKFEREEMNSAITNWNINFLIRQSGLGTNPLTLDTEGHCVCSGPDSSSKSLDAILHQHSEQTARKITLYQHTPWINKFKSKQLVRQQPLPLFIMTQ